MPGNRCVSFAHAREEEVANERGVTSGAASIIARREKRQRGQQQQQRPQQMERQQPGRKRERKQQQRQCEVQGQPAGGNNSRASGAPATSSDGAGDVRRGEEVIIVCGDSEESLIITPMEVGGDDCGVCGECTDAGEAADENETSSQEQDLGSDLRGPPQNRTRRTDAVLSLREPARESFERLLRAHRRGAGPIVLHSDGRSRHGRRRRGVG